MRRVGVVRLRAIIYFEVVSTLALLVGLAVGNSCCSAPASISF
jgi:Na+/H+-dicarboxylate symporter